MREIRLVIFDLDGTLLYTIKDINVALNYALKKNNLDSVTIEECLYMVGSGTEGLIKKAIKGNDNLYESVRKDYREYYLAHNKVYTNPYQGIIHLLKMLKQARIKLAVLSNKTNNNTIDVINHYFPDTFDYVLGSRADLALKPASDGIRLVLDYFNISKENVLYLGDSEIDLQTANNSDLLFGACLWGYRKKEELAGSKLFFANPKEVENYILKNNNLLLNGAIILDKPSGLTSQETLNDVKHILSSHGLAIEKIGHAGTLDPLASGVLVILLNEATKLSNYLLASDKEYICVCRLGEESDTYDIDGKTINTSDKYVSIDEVNNVLTSMIGKQKQVPPAYSAIKLDGKKAYDLARSGKEVKIDARDIEIYDIKLTSNLVSNRDFEFVCKVSKGTYIRSLCHDIGLKLGTFGLVKSLRRSMSGKYDITSANTIDDLKEGNYKIIPMEEIIDIPKCIVSEEIYKKVMDGKALTKDEVNKTKAKEVALIYLDKLIGIYYYDNNTNRFKAKRVWN